MIDEHALNVLLMQWGREYGDSPTDGPGWNSRNALQTAIEHQGFMPDSRGFVPIPVRTEADEVEQLVREMEVSGWFCEAKVVRIDYFFPTIAIHDRLTRLRGIGITLSRSGYYEKLARAKALLAGALRRRVA